MKARDHFNYDSPEYEQLRRPARDVIAAYQDANRFLDTVQEWIYIESAMPKAARVIHNLAHEQPKRFDRFSDMLHERHLMAEYPPTPELREEIREMDDAFAVVISALDRIQTALVEFRATAERSGQLPMALYAEEAMVENSASYTRVLEMWNLWDTGVSASSFDNWCGHLLEEEDADA